MRPFNFRNCAGQANDLTAWAITVGDWVNYRLLKQYMNNLNSLKEPHQDALKILSAPRHVN
jgi:hypothetical protein